MSGRKRRVLVDGLGLVLRVRVHAADLQDRAAGPLVLVDAGRIFPRRAHLWAHQGYTGAGRSWIEQHLGWTVEIAQHPPRPRGSRRFFPDADDPDAGHFEWVRLLPATTRFRGVLPRRWVAERTFSWLGQSRRLSKEYERLCETSEAMIYATMSRPVLRRLARP